MLEIKDTLRIRDADGNWVTVPVIKGDKGDLVLDPELIAADKAAPASAVGELKTDLTRL